MRKLWRRGNDKVFDHDLVDDRATSRTANFFAYAQTNLKVSDAAQQTPRWTWLIDADPANE